MEKTRTKLDSEMVSEAPQLMTADEALRQGLVPVSQQEYETLQRMSPLERRRFARTLLKRRNDALVKPGKELASVHPAALQDAKRKNQRKAARRARG